MREGRLNVPNSTDYGYNLPLGDQNAFGTMQHIYRSSSRLE
jgi:hypothetical protein